MKMKIGFIGLGIMGSRMAANLQKHGYRLVVCNRTRAKAEALLGLGRTLCDSLAKLADLQRIRPLLLCMGNKIVHTGGHGSGTSMKMVINLLLGTGMAAFSEAMALGEGLGLSPKLLFDSLLGTPPVAPFLALKREKIE